MRFSCDECGRSYVAADEVSGRAFRMRCKDCGHEIVVRPPLAQPAATASEPAAPAVTPPAALTPPPTSAPSRPPPAPRAARSGPFDPFEGQDVAADEPVEPGSLEILDRTPPAIRLPPKPPASAPAAPAAPARTPPPPRPAAPPRARTGRMLPAEDEAMLGPPGEEGRRAIPRWLIAVVLAGVAAVGGILLRR